MTEIVHITPEQCRAARAILNWTQLDLAEKADLSRKTVADFEHDIRVIRARTRRDLSEVFARNGIELIPGGVRRAQPSTEAKAAE